MSDARPEPLQASPVVPISAGLLTAIVGQFESDKDQGDTLRRHLNKKEQRA